MAIYSKGYAHGFVLLSNTTVIYKVDNYYNPEADTGIIWNDSFDIPWPIENNNYSISDKIKLPTWKELKEKGAKGGHGG